MYNESNKAATIPTGFKSIDVAGNMLRRGKLSILAGRVSMGKSRFVLNLTARLLKQGFKVCYVSTQSNAEYIKEDLLEINGPDDFTELSIVDNLNLLSKPSEWKNMLEEECSKCDVMIIDELYENVAQDIAEFISKFPKTAFLALMGVSRAVEERTNHRPGITDILGIDGIRKCVYCAATLYREDYYGCGYSYDDGFTHCLEISFHLWDRNPACVFLSVAKNFKLSEFRSGIVPEGNAGDTHEEIYRFIESRDYREFFSSVRYEFTPLEKVWLAWQCRNMPQDEKLAAIREYASEDPGYVIKERPWFKEDMTLSDFVDAFVADKEGMKELSKECEWMRNGFTALWLDFPVPFARGDLLQEIDGDGAVYLYCGGEEIPEALYNSLQAKGDITDMEIKVWTFHPSSGFSHTYILPFRLQAYCGSICHDNPVLGMASDYLKGKVDLMTLLDGMWKQQ